MNAVEVTWHVEGAVECCFGLPVSEHSPVTIKILLWSIKFRFRHLSDFSDRHVAHDRPRHFH